MIREPRSALLKQYEKQFAIDGVSFRLTDDAATEVAALANERGTGARGLRSLLEALLLDAMYDAPDRRGCTVVLDQSGASMHMHCC